MADQRLGNRMGVVAASVGGGTNRSNINGAGAGDTRGEHEDTDYTSITALRARLSALDAGFYTATRLNTMTYNDMVYAVRQADSATTIKQ